MVGKRLKGFASNKMTEQVSTNQKSEFWSRVKNIFEYVLYKMTEQIRTYTYSGDLILVQSFAGEN